MRKTVFLDRDGVINRLVLARGRRETPCTASEFTLLPRAKPALRRLKEAGFCLVVVTNQPNIAKGKCHWADYEAIAARMASLLGDEAGVDQIYSCLHHPDPAQVVVPELLAECSCRKPKPGLILQAAREGGLDLARAWLIGDSPTDIEAGQAAGLSAKRLLFIGKPYNNRIAAVRDLWEAAQFILEKETR